MTIDEMIKHLDTGAPYGCETGEPNASIIAALRAAKKMRQKLEEFQYRGIVTQEWDRAIGGEGKE